MKLVLIGGESQNNLSDNSLIDSSIVLLTNKKSPNFLFIGLASSYSDSKYDQIKKIYQNLNCNCQNLKRKNLINNPSIVEDKINNADIIYFCGGDTIKLLDDIYTFKLEKLLYDALNRGCVLAGVSAGAIILSREGYSDSYIIRGESSSYSFISGLGYFDYCIVPHYNILEKKEQLMKDIINSDKAIYGLEDDTAIIFDDDKIHYVTSNNHIYKIEVCDGNIHEECI